MFHEVKPAPTSANWVQFQATAITAMCDDDQAVIGRVLGHYEIVQTLGQGGMGVVYKAHDKHLDRFVALKVLPADKVADSKRKLRFIQEAKAASALRHPNIVVVHDIAAADGVDYIAMEYVAGQNLQQLLTGKPLPLREALSVAVQVADGLAAAHHAGIIHRDLKPANIMVDERTNQNVKGSSPGARRADQS